MRKVITHIKSCIKYYRLFKLRSRSTKLINKLRRLNDVTLHTNVKKYTCDPHHLFNSHKEHVTPPKGGEYLVVRDVTNKYHFLSRSFEAEWFVLQFPIQLNSNAQDILAELFLIGDMTLQINRG